MRTEYKNRSQWGWSYDKGAEEVHGDYFLTIKCGEANVRNFQGEIAQQFFAELLALDNLRLEGRTGEAQPHLDRLRELRDWFRNRTGDWPREVNLSFHTDRGYDLRWAIDCNGLPSIHRMGGGRFPADWYQPNDLGHEMDAPLPRTSEVSP